MAGEASSSWVVEIEEAPGSMFEAEYWKKKAEHWKKKAEHWKKRSIYKVPAYITDMNPKAYLPRVVSFGPYHHDKEHLKPMEEHKERALVNFINRSGKPFKLFVEAMSKVLDDLMACYDPLDQKWRDDRHAFLHLMILDGCFMLEFLVTAMIWGGGGYGYAPDDPIFGDHGKIYIMPHIRTDMLMLENQLPMLALDTLVAVESDGLKDKKSVKALIQNFNGFFTRPGETGKCLHVLDAFRNSLLIYEGCPSNNIKEQSDSVIFTTDIKEQFDSVIFTTDKFRSATELDEAGIQFSKSRSVSLDDVSFRSGVLRLPVIFVNETTESIFLNIIAFERSHVGAGSEVSSCIYLMSTLLSNERDVALLHSKGIIWNELGKDEEVVRLFKSLTMEIVIHPENKLFNIYMHINSYCEKPWRKIRAKVVHTYFRSPWNIVNLIGAIFLFVLTVIQTIYTIYK